MVVAVGWSTTQLINGGIRVKMWQRGGGGESQQFLRRIWRSVNQVCKYSAVVFAARCILIAKGSGSWEDDDGRTWQWRMSYEGCLVQSNAKNRFKACIVWYGASLGGPLCDTSKT